MEMQRERCAELVTRRGFSKWVALSGHLIDNDSTAKPSKRTKASLPVMPCYLLSNLGEPEPPSTTAVHTRGNKGTGELSRVEIQVLWLPSPRPY